MGEMSNVRTRNILLFVSGLTVLAVLIAVAIAVPLTSDSSDAIVTDSLEHAKSLMRKVPVIDGHNDLPGKLRSIWRNQLADVNLNDDLSNIHTDIPRLQEGLVGGQFWSAYVPCNTQYKDAVRQTQDQIDVIRRFSQQYDEFEFVTTAQGILDAHAAGKIASMIGMEGGHSIDSSLASLRLMYDAGARYMTLTHNCNTPWADNNLASGETLEFGGLSEWGKDLVREMNRLGMLVDISHVAPVTMHDVLDVTQAPVIFSHSAAKALCNYSRNVPDDVLDRLVENKGIVMVVFYPAFLNCEPDVRDVCDIAQVADHIEHIVSVCGYGCVGFGSDYDGVGSLPVGLEDVSKYPYLVEEMVNRSWTDENIEKLIGMNLIRVLEETESVRDSMAGMVPYEAWLPQDDSEAELNNLCRTSYSGWPSYPSDTQE